MTKRTKSSGPSSSQKRSKLTAGKQLRLDSFLSPSRGPPSTSTPTSLTGKPSSAGAQDVIDVDTLDDAVSTKFGTSDAGPSTIASKTGLPVPDSPLSPTKVLNFGFTIPTQPTETNYLPLDVNPVLYSPEDQPWASKEAPYSLLSHAFATLSKTKSRIAIINTLVNTLVTVIYRHPPSLLPTLYLLSNSLVPPYASIELGIGGSVLSKAIQHVSGLSGTALRKLYNTMGDVGDVAFAAKSKVRTLIPHAPLTIKGVYESLLQIAKCKGQGASQQKEKFVEGLLVAGTGEEIRYLVRTLAQNLRVGAVRTSILTALARAFALRPPPGIDSSSPCLYVPKPLLDQLSQSEGKKKENTPAHEELKAIFTGAETLVKEVYVQHPCYDDIASALLCHGLSELAERVPLTVGIPLHPALGSPTRSLDEIYDRLGDAAFSAEFKYDGQRAQIHVNLDQEGKTCVKIFSRHLEDMTSKYPDVVGLMEQLQLRLSTAASFILDSEIVAIDPTTGDLKSFQDLSSRSRKDVKLAQIKVSVCVFAFDLLYFNKPLLLEPFRGRRRLLKQNFAPYKADDQTLAHFDFVVQCESTAGKAAVLEFWETAVASHCEGLMIKVLDSAEDSGKTPVRTSRRTNLPATYEPDKRTSAWLKLKKDYVEGLGDSLDLVPIGAWYGNGRKAGWWSPILLGLWDSNRGKVVAMCKCMSGFTDTFYKNLSETYSLDTESCSDQSLWDCELGGFRPDVYFRPKEVWEIRGADITESPVSIAARGLVHRTRGLSLRFPRFIRVRPDKSVEQASTPGFLVNIWRQQHGKPVATGADDGDLVDVVSEGSGTNESEEDFDGESN